MKSRILILFFLLSIAFIKAQSKNYELGNVTKAELTETKNVSDTSAAAVILFKKAKTIFKYNSKSGFISETEFSIKIKIYKKEGLSWANFEIPYYIGYSELNKDMVEISKAYTYNYENGEIVKSKVTSESKFEEKVNEFWKTKSIVFPNVKEGSIIELKYILKSENLSILPEFQYQYKIPVCYAEYITEIPEFYIYKGIQSGFVDVTRDDKLENGFQNFEDKYGRSMSMSYSQIKTVYVAKNIPSLVEEVYVNNIDNYYAKIDHELQTIRMPEEEPKQIATTWEDVVKSIYKEKEFGGELEKTDYFSNDLKLLIANLSNEKDKMNKIFNYIKGLMVWNNKYGYYTKVGVEKAFKDKVGNVAEINLMLVSMLKMAGIEAKPVLISTRDNGVALFPNRTRFNYVIALAIIDGQNVLLDATDRNSLPNILPLRDLNWVGRSIEKNGVCSEIDLMPKLKSNDNVSMVAEITSEGHVSGKIKEQFIEYEAQYFREKYSKLAEENYLERLEKKHNIIVSDYTSTILKDLGNSVSEVYSFKSENSIEIIGDKMYFSPLLFFAINQNPFKQEQRKYPVDFQFPFQERYMLSVKIPEGYSVESIPKPINMPISGDLANFKYNLSNSESQIQVSVTLDINSAIISTEDYNALKEFFKRIVEKENEKIVLKKI